MISNKQIAFSCGSDFFPYEHVKNSASMTRAWAIP
jgi:hypothetical protein